MHCLTVTKCLAGTTGTTAPRIPCVSMEDRVTLNYADTVGGDSAFVFRMMLGDGSRLKDEEKALQGSGSWLPLPSAGSHDRPVYLLITPSAILQQMRVASVSLSVVYAEKVDIEIYDFERQVAAEHTVRLFTCTAAVVLVLLS